jgi:predicted metalloprotease with PDZ domain
MDLSENRHVPIGVFHDDWDRLLKGDVWGNMNKLLSGSEDLTPKDKPKDKPKAEEKPAPPTQPAPREPAPQPSAKPAVWLGIVMDVIDGNVTVTEVADGSPAQKAGVELEDVITKIDGKAVGGTGDVAARVRSASVGDSISLTVLRGGKEQDLSIKLAERK